MTEDAADSIQKHLEDSLAFLNRVFDKAGGDFRWTAQADAVDPSKLRFRCYSEGGILFEVCTCPPSDSCLVYSAGNFGGHTDSFESLSEAAHSLESLYRYWKALRLAADEILLKDGRFRFTRGSIASAKTQGRIVAYRKEVNDSQDWIIQIANGPITMHEKGSPVALPEGRAAIKTVLMDFSSRLEPREISSRFHVFASEEDALKWLASNLDDFAEEQHHDGSA